MKDAVDKVNVWTHSHLLYVMATACTDESKTRSNLYIARDASQRQGRHAFIRNVTQRETAWHVGVRAAQRTM